MLLTVSRLTWDKGYREMIAAARSLFAAGRDFRLLAVGSGKDEAPIRQAVGDAGLTERIIFLGWRDDVADLYAAADVFVFASHREGLPIAPIEAMASGLPVLASALPGCREELGDNEYGLLFPIGDVAALVDNLTRLLDNAALRRHYAEVGRLRAEAFDQERVVALQMELYRQLAESR